MKISKFLIFVVLMFAWFAAVQPAVAGPVWHKRCHGTGYIPCNVCHGESANPLSGIHCPECHDTGKVKCPRCHGSGILFSYLELGNA